MNQIIILPEDRDADNHAILEGRRLAHLREVLGKTKGDRVRAGIFGDLRGWAVIESIDTTRAVLSLDCTEPPPAKMPLTLVTALQRPRTMKKVIQCATSIGVGKIYIIRTWRVEKGYFSNPVLTPKGLDEQIILGLEQSLDTIPPHIEIRTRFRPFVEDELPSLIAESSAIAAHPYAEKPCPRDLDGPVVLAIGPEGGFIPFEIELLSSIGFTPVTVGDRILRTEFAIPFIAGRLFP